LSYGKPIIFFSYDDDDDNQTTLHDELEMDSVPRTSLNADVIAQDRPRLNDRLAGCRVQGPACYSIDTTVSPFIDGVLDDT